MDKPAFSIRFEVCRGSWYVYVTNRLLGEGETVYSKPNLGEALKTFNEEVSKFTDLMK